jgi:hypothetical protein
MIWHRRECGNFQVGCVLQLCGLCLWTASLQEIVLAWCDTTKLDPMGFAVIWMGKRVPGSTAFATSGIPSGSTCEISRHNGTAAAAVAAPPLSRPTSAIVAESSAAGGAGAALVRVALQIPSGAILVRVYEETRGGGDPATRVQAQLPCRLSLWDILLAFEAAHGLKLTRITDTEGMFCCPVLVETNREFTGLRALKNTTLSKLGITGSVLFRFDLRKSQLTMAQVDGELQAIETDRVQAESHAQLLRQQYQQQQSEEQQRRQQQEQERLQRQQSEQQQEQQRAALSARPSLWVEHALTVAAALNNEVPAAAERAVAVQTFRSIANNLLKPTKQDLYRQLKLNNTTFHARIFQWNHGRQCLEALGFIKQTNQQVCIL